MSLARISTRSLAPSCLSRSSRFSAAPIKALTISKRSTSYTALKELDERKGDRERVLILGSGWGGYGLARSLDTKYYQPIVVSPRTYFVFTPLLASTAVGTLEFRTAMESTRMLPGVEVVRGWASNFSPGDKTISIEGLFEKPLKTTTGTGEDESLVPDKEHTFALKYDHLVVAVGSYSHTFNCPGVSEHAFFLKDISDARRIRRRILERFEEAALPTVPQARKRDLLHFAVVGGGPTGIELSAELHDLLREDIPKAYGKELAAFAKITVFDVAPNILGAFDKTLQAYARAQFSRQNIDIMTSHHVEQIEADAIVTKEEGRIPVGMVVWSTGLAPNPFVSGPLAREFEDQGVNRKIVLDEKTKSLKVDNFLRVQAQPSDGKTPPLPMPGVYAIGDCAVVDEKRLPATAQVADQEAMWLAKALNTRGKRKENGVPVLNGVAEATGQKPFVFRSLGIMAYVGSWTAITQSGKVDLKGRLAWLLWRTAYLTKSVSWRNRLLLPVYWFTNWILGRDINRF